MSTGATSVDLRRQAMPVERFEPSTLAGLVFETSAYTVPPHRPIKLTQYKTPYNLSSKQALCTTEHMHNTILPHPWQELFLQPPYSCENLLRLYRIVYITYKNNAQNFSSNTKIL
jgi:hypothetical protein